MSRASDENHGTEQFDVTSLLSVTMSEPFRTQAVKALAEIARLRKSKQYARTKQEMVFGRHSPYPILKGVELSPSARTALGTRIDNLADWLLQAVNGDIDEAYYAIRERVRTKARRPSDETDDQVEVLQEFGDLIDLLGPYLREDSTRRPITPFCRFCWRHPRDVADRLFCLEHVPERANSSKPGDLSGYMAGRRFISRVAKILDPNTSAEELKNPSDHLCKKVWRTLKGMQESEMTDRRNLNAAWMYINDNEDTFDTPGWPVLARYVEQYRQGLPRAKDNLQSIAPLQTESREEWLARILRLLDNLDAYDDLIREPGHILGLLSRYDQYLIALGLLPPEQNTEVIRAQSQILRKEGLKYVEIGERLGISKQWAQILCVGRRKKPNKGRLVKGRHIKPGRAKKR
jgi:hypothetical protein